MERPYVPFYKPYGMTDEEYEYEVRIAEQRLAEWEAENEALQQSAVMRSLPDANPHQCALCGWGCTCSNQPCSCCSGNDA